MLKGNMAKNSSKLHNGQMLHNGKECDAVNSSRQITKSQTLKGGTI